MIVQPDVVVDVEVVCRRVLADPRRARVSTMEQVAVCSFALEHMAEVPPIRASLAASLALAISAFAGFGEARDARDAGEEAGTAETVDLREAELSAWETFETAFDTLKNRFEKEFPDGSHTL